MMTEHWILVAIWISGFTGAFLFIPRKNRRKGFLAYLMFQAIIWFCDMFAFKFGLLKAPIRELPKATDIPLTINYFFYPVLFSVYYTHLQSQQSKKIYFFVWISTITLFDIIIERYTDLLEYGFITWYTMWIYIGFLFYVSQACCNWFVQHQTDGRNSYEN